MYLSLWLSSSEWINLWIILNYTVYCIFLLKKRSPSIIYKFALIVSRWVIEKDTYICETYISQFFNIKYFISNTDFKSPWTCFYQYCIYDVNVTAVYTLFLFAFPAGRASRKVYTIVLPLEHLPREEGKSCRKREKKERERGFSVVYLNRLRYIVHSTRNWFEISLFKNTANVLFRVKMKSKPTTINSPK